MQTFRRSLAGALLLFLAAQGFAPFLHAARNCGAAASMGATCCCCRQAGAKDGCPMCKRAARHGAVRCGCGCQGQPADAMTAPAFDPIAVLPDQVPGFVDLAFSFLPAPYTVAFGSFTPIPPAPPPWLASILPVSCSQA